MNSTLSSEYAIIDNDPVIVIDSHYYLTPCPLSLPFVYLLPLIYASAKNECVSIPALAYAIPYTSSSECGASATVQPVLPALGLALYRSRGFRGRGGWWYPGPARQSSSQKISYSMPLVHPAHLLVDRSDFCLDQTCSSDVQVIFYVTYSTGPSLEINSEAAGVERYRSQPERR
ncbi:hypothetical protein BDV93DRAFT_176659 [Ceratobasidium sp. AG-I]|nr:hypothetical protein BDV93DRAFT_176659 [Ceratobasidium sp. AG-I]